MKLIILIGLMASCWSPQMISVEADRIDDLFAQMSVEDKCGQMTQIDSGLLMDTGPDGERFLNTTKLVDALVNKRLGSMFNLPYIARSKQTVFDFVNAIHAYALNSTRLRIPILYASDMIHGAALIDEGVVFPQQLAIASTFNTNTASRIGAIAGMESRAIGLDLNYSPILDTGRQPLWPRLWETFGEDAHVVTRMGEAYVWGHQGSDLKNRSKTPVCLKHYMGYGLPFNGRDRSSVYIPDPMLREKFLAPFAKSIETGAMSIMINSGWVNGIPTHANKYILTDILRNELGFRGFTISDWQDVIRLHTRDRMAETPEEAVRISVMAGLDMSMVPNDYSFYDYCSGLARKDAAFAKRVDESAMRILRFKDAVGLFDDPFPRAEDLNKVALQESIDFNLEAARETIILAKNVNNNFLPLDPSANLRILVTGATANIVGPLMGAWTYTWQGDDETTLTTVGRKKYSVFESIQRTNVNTKYVEGSNLTSLTNVNEAIAEARNSDVVVLCVGETAYAETPGNIDNLAIASAQAELGRRLAAEAGKPIVLVYLGGRPRLINNMVEAASAVLIGFYPGERGGEAIADVIFGRYNPSARLPITYPAHPNGFNNYDLSPMEDFEFNKYEYLFPFGHGLSYTRFDYANLTLSSHEIRVPDEVEVSVAVTNVGARDGNEVVMLFLNDQVASLPQPVRKLKKFTKVSLRAGETRTVRFCLGVEDLKFVNAQSKWVYEPGRFNVYVEKLNDFFNLLA